MKPVSLLLASGFSVPAGVKTVGQLNRAIIELKEDEFYIDSDQTLILLNGQSKPEMTIHWRDEKFFVSFIAWYCMAVDPNFNYEKFYDYFTSFQRFGNHKKEIEKFFEPFKKDVLQSTNPIDNTESYILRFSNYFGQLISSLLNTKEFYEDTSLLNYPRYEMFIYFLKSLINKGIIVHSHTLNHDLLFEHLAKHVDLAQHFTDGYSEYESPYYGSLHTRTGISKSYKVRLKHFTNSFNNPVRLYKLHGSVDTYRTNMGYVDPDLIRVKKDWGIGEMFMETSDVHGNYKYTGLHQYSYPDILSGVSAKSALYKEPFYENLLEQFKSNLNESNILIVIGYGFRDVGINHLVENEFLNTGKTMIVIDPELPSSRLIHDFKAKTIVSSIDAVSTAQWDKIIADIV